MIFREEKEFSRREVRDQEFAFKQSLQQDIMKQEKKDLANILEESKKEAITYSRRQALEKFHALPEISPNSDPKPIKIGLRMPDGARLNKLFATSSKFEVIFF